MRVTVRLFGSAREAAGAQDLGVELPAGARLADLRARVARDPPALGRLGLRLRAARNLELVGEEEPLADGDEVAFLPPVSGGGARCTLSERPLDPHEGAHRVGHLEIGELAVVVAAAAPHRAEAFEACRFAIDRLKERVPIWKKEVSTDGAEGVDEHP